MTDYGVTISGFVLKRLDDIKSEIESALRLSLGPEINLLPESVLGQIIGIISERESLVWELAEAVYNSQYPDTSEGVSLDNVVALTGITRKGATYSTGNGIARGTATTVIPAGSVISVVGNPDSRFVTDADAAITAGFSRVQRVTFSDTPDSGAFKLDYNGNITTSLPYNISASALATAFETASGEPVKVEGSMAAKYFEFVFRSEGTKVIIVEDTNTLLKVATPVTTSIAMRPGALISVTGEATGPFSAPADSLTEIETPISGWDSFVNPEDIDIGQNVETDQELKIRRLTELAKAGRATIDAIIANLREIEDVQTVVVFQNNTAVTDIDGRPPHSVDIVVQGGTNAEIATVIFDSVAAGITMIGDITETVIDSQGFNQTIKFSRPTEVDIYVIVDITKDPNKYPTDGDQRVEDAILAYGDTLGVGDDVIVHPAMEASIGAIHGITDVVFKVGIAPAPTLDNNIVMTPRQLAVFDSARITVNS